MSVHFTPLILYPALLYLFILRPVYTIDASLLPHTQGGGSISMKLVDGDPNALSEASQELEDSVDAASHRKLAKFWGKYKPTLESLSKLEQSRQEQKDAEQTLNLTQVDNNVDAELLPSSVLQGRPRAKPSSSVVSQPKQAGEVGALLKQTGALPKLVVSDLMLPKPARPHDEPLDPAILAPPAVKQGEPVITSVSGVPSSNNGQSSGSPVSSTNVQSPVKDSKDIDPCLVCDCTSSPNLLNCNRRNLHNNYTNVLSSKTLSYKFTTICLSNNEIERLTPFPHLEQITRLCLSNNPIREIQTGVFRKLQNLVALDLSHTKLTGFVLTPNAFEGNYAPDYYEPLRSLKILNLSHNEFHSLNADLFEHLPNLEELHLSHNPLTVIDMPTIIALNSINYLKVLDLSSTGLSSLPNHLLHTPRYLHTLDLSYNLFTTVPEQLSQSHQLQNLNLNGNPIAVIKSFPALPKLSTLSLSNMPELVALQENSLANVPLLQSFSCANNSKLVLLHGTTFQRTSVVTSDNGNERTSTVVWPPLEKLILSNNALQRLDGTLVARWDRLKLLDIRFNPWLCDCENQWMVSSLIPILEANHPQFLNNIKCREPVEMANINLLDLDHKNYHMRCLDLFNHRPETDSILLIVALLVALLSVPLCLNLILCARKRRSAPPTCPNVHYSRAFYKPGVRTGSTSDVISTHYIL
uniref:Leucine-rich repeat neuronal protein 1 n=3 Tax=Cacopsylla melanoneura TaxID=428564 RepID=A0A8D8W5Y2_9HEMI